MADSQTLKGFKVNLFESKKVYEKLLERGEIDEGDLNLVEEDDSLKVDETLKFSKEGVLGVNTTTEVEKDNTLPITAAAVHTTVGNIEVLLGTI